MGRSKKYRLVQALMKITGLLSGFIDTLVKA